MLIFVGFSVVLVLEDFLGESDSFFVTFLCDFFWTIFWSFFNDLFVTFFGDTCFLCVFWVSSHGELFLVTFFVTFLVTFSLGTCLEEGALYFGYFSLFVDFSLLGDFS